MQVSDALARANRTNEEFALYDQLLRELAAKASGVPIGTNPGFAGQSGARSGEYVQVLDKYLSRLAALNRPLDALRVYRTEIDRNPNDPGLYQRLAAFLEQNGMAREVEDDLHYAPSRSSPIAPGTTSSLAGICGNSNTTRSRRSAAMPSPCFPAPNSKPTSARSSPKPTPMPRSTAS